MEVVAIVGLGRRVDDEAPKLAADLGLTVYETAVMLRAPPPIIVLRSDDHGRTSDLTARLRSRGHDAVVCDLETVTSSEQMFRPRSFHFEGSDLVATGGGVVQRLPAAAVFALLRANHTTRIEDTITTREQKLSLGRAALTGGLMMTKTTSSEERRVTTEREPVLYVFRIDGPPWLLCGMQMRYEGLGGAMRPSRIENFEVLQTMLREHASSAPYDKRLLAIRSTPTIIASSSSQVSASSSWTLDILAHVLASSLAQAARPYR